MDGCHCSAYPLISASDSDSEINPVNSDNPYFNIKFEYTNTSVLNARSSHVNGDTTYHKFSNISKDELMQETTIVSWLSQMCVPCFAHKFVVENILKCARWMASSTWNKCTKVLYMCVDVVITRPNEEVEDRREEEVEDDDEDEDEDDDDDDDDRLVPAARSVVEGLEVEKDGSAARTCAICFEDFLDGVRMPCLHMFHKTCIVDWLQVGHSCPVCRFKMATDENK
ncbi:uncharacterized protein LOC113855623 [Abrus precatorius]|uniref:Uncharacterized protein LOC113855623 n=1 Tax=Abrus precatorius TaxID=3816 RepID=A0A8B8KGW2_ABRPR|nr:uncharacterized protein LOC113855623 [Abrus precatorius]